MPCYCNETSNAVTGRIPNLQKIANYFEIVFEMAFLMLKVCFDPYNSSSVLSPKLNKQFLMMFHVRDGKSCFLRRI